MSFCIFILFICCVCVCPELNYMHVHMYMANKADSDIQARF